MQTVTFRAMGSQIFIALDTEEKGVLEAAWKAREWFEEWEQAFSRFRISSELSILNKLPGVPVRVSEPLFEILKLSMSFQEMTGGIFNPLILNSLEFAGYNVTFDELSQNINLFVEQEGLPLSSNDAEIKIIEDDRSVVIPYGYKLDLGGVAKGWAANLTMARLQHLAPILVDAGGDIAVSQPKQDDSFWPVGITDPFSPDKTLDLLMISKGGIATSGRDFRRWKMNGKWMHHLIDTRNDRPAVTDIVSATVISKDVIFSEAAAKCAVILGSGEATQWLTNQQGIEYLLLLENQRFISSDGYRFIQWNESCQPTLSKK